MPFSPLTQRRLKRFKKNKRAFISLIIFAFFFILSLFAEFIANDKPIILIYNGRLYLPVIISYSESEFGGFFDTEADYKDPFIQELLKECWALWPPVRFSYDTIRYDAAEPPPTPPTLENPLGLDNHGRDVFARLLYGFRLSVLFGFILTIFSSFIGVLIGALQGYYGGRIDLYGQRLIEIWSGIPLFYLLILASGMIRPGFWSLLIIMTLFSWTHLIAVVRAEFLKGRNLEYVRAAIVLGVKDRAIMFRHILPNALISAMTFLPFILSGSIGTLTSLDFLGLGMPPGTPSIGELLAAGKSNLHAPWLGISAFIVVAGMLSLLVFVGEGLRDALDPRTKNV
ncbi:MAG: ABC transporter permease [Deferribacteraceae bacterium]|jgi:microcin C transport system permease protein|nr:ABC transporter permease [Deferribacteraceae bacterium]